MLFHTPCISGPRNANCCREAGFSIFETVVVMAVVATFLSIGMHHFDDSASAFRRSESQRQFEADVRRARQEAVAKGSRVALIMEGGNTYYSVGFDYLPYEGAATVEETAFRTSLPDGITLTLSAPILFDSRGMLIQPDGSPTTIVGTFGQGGSTYCAATLFPNGAISMACT
jgi:type II secretory pathway pseudopilin PulG